MTEKIYTVNEIRDIVIPIAKRHRITRMYLFGSYARGEADHTSDIDLRIDAKNIPTLFALGGIYADLEEALDKPIDIVLTDALHKNLSDPVTRRMVRNMKKDEVLLFEETAPQKEVPFELYKSHICHRVKDSGDIPFITETLKSGEIRRLYEQKKYPEALYLLAMVDYLSRENDLPLCAEYRDIRACKLKQPMYPESILAYAIVTGDENIKQKSLDDSIPEFKRFNIVENEIRNII